MTKYGVSTDYSNRGLRSLWELYQDLLSGFAIARGFAGGTVTQSIFLCLMAVLFFDLAIRDSIRNCSSACRILTILVKIAWETCDNAGWNEMQRSAKNCDFVRIDFKHPHPLVDDSVSVYSKCWVSVVHIV